MKKHAKYWIIIKEEPDYSKVSSYIETQLKFIEVKVRCQLTLFLFSFLRTQTFRNKFNILQDLYIVM